MRVEIQIRENHSEEDEAEWVNITLDRVIRMVKIPRYYEMRILVDGKPALTWDQCRYGNIDMDEFLRIGIFFEAFEKMNQMHSLFERLTAVADAYGAVAINRTSEGGYEVLDPTKYVLVMEEGVTGGGE
jgi:hypothetical protein